MHQRLCLWTRLETSVHQNLHLPSCNWNLDCIRGPENVSCASFAEFSMNVSWSSQCHWLLRQTTDLHSLFYIHARIHVHVLYIRMMRMTLIRTWLSNICKPDNRCVAVSSIYTQLHYEAWKVNVWSIRQFSNGQKYKPEILSSWPSSGWFFNCKLRKQLRFADSLRPGAEVLNKLGSMQIRAMI